MPPEAALPIDAAGRLAVRSPGGVELCVEARGATLQVEVATVRELLRLRRDYAGLAGSDTDLGGAAKVARLTDLSCVVHLRRREIARLGPQTQPNWLGRMLGLTPARVDWRALLASLFNPSLFNR
jgi:hypothetical protein